MPTSTQRRPRLEARIGPDALAIIRRAAEIEGRSVSDFVVSAAQDAARRTIAEAQLVRLSVEDQARLDLLLEAHEPAPALERAAAAHKALIIESQ
jgi:uncharacterized protein (DUF1778 family)